MVEDHDEFWNVALSTSADLPTPWTSHDDDHTENDDLVNDTQNCIRYKLPTTSITLEVWPLPAEDGVWSPLGGNAWYASALLATLLLTVLEVKDADDAIPCNPSELLETVATHHHAVSLTKDILINKEMNSKRSWNILELGSGAVGLSGIACAIALDRLRQQEYPDGFDKTALTARECLVDAATNVVLSDNEPCVLAQLSANVQHNQRYWMDASTQYCSVGDECVASSTTSTHVHVQNLDWNTPLEICTCLAENERPADSNDDDAKSSSTSPSIDLVIGSELVYTEENAVACTNLLIHLLSTNLNVGILIVQVTDRYGWEEVLIPRLQEFGASIQSVLLPVFLHDIASTMITPGGTLDLHSYGAVFIRNGKKEAKNGETND